MFELLQPTHLIFVLVVALVVLGPKRLAEVSRSLGRGLQELKEHKDEFKEGLLGVSDGDGLGDEPGDGRKDEPGDGPQEKRPAEGHPGDTAGQRNDRDRK